MATSAERGVLLGSALFVSAAACAQPGTTFAYTGNDAVASAMNMHNAHFGGISNSVLVVGEENFTWPYLPALFYEYDYLVLPRNPGFNVLLGATPEINFFPLFMGRVSGLAELGFLAEADNKPGQGFGVRLGGGFTGLGSTFGFTESSPVIRAGFVVDNMRITYMYCTSKPIYINHQVTIGLKFDW